MEKLEFTESMMPKEFNGIKYFILMKSLGKTIIIVIIFVEDIINKKEDSNHELFKDLNKILFILKVYDNAAIPFWLLMFNRIKFDLNKIWIMIKIKLKIKMKIVRYFFYFYLFFYSL